MILNRTLRHKQLSTTAANPADWFIDFLGGGMSSSGIRVNANSALHLAPYFAALRCISEDVAKVPLLLYRRKQPRGKKRLTKDPRFKLLHDQPNAHMSSMTWRETLMSHALGWGNGYSEIIFNSLGQVVALELLLPHQVVPGWDRNRSRLRYRVTENSAQRFIPDFRMFHLHGLGFDGITGYSIAHLARDTIGLGLAQERSGSKLFENAVQSAGVLEHPGKLSPEAMRNLRESWERTYGGVDNSGKTVILEEGMKFSSRTIPFKDAQWIEGRGFSVQDIARFFRIPPHMIAELSKSSFSNIQEQSLEYVTHTLMAWFVRFEQECKRKLLSGPRDDDIFVEHLVDGLLRGNVAARYGAYSTARQWGWMSANDVLELENRNSIGEQGDIYLVPMNMAPADKISDEPEPPPEPDSPDNDDAPNPGLGVVIADEVRAIARERPAEELAEGVAEIYRPLFAQLYADKLKIEYDRVDTILAKRDRQKLLDRFYGDHFEHVRTALDPLCVAFCRSVWSVCGEGDMPDDWTQQAHITADSLAHEHVKQSRGTIDEIDKWRTERPEQQSLDARRAMVTQLKGLIDGNQLAT